MNHLKKQWLGALTALVIAALAATGMVYSVSASGNGQTHGAGQGHAVGPSIERTQQAVDFRGDMRKLWEDHITWTRLFIVSFGADLPDLDATTARLLQNQADIGNSVKQFYGEDAGNHLTELLREHILGAAAVLAAAKSGDAAAFNEANDAWYENAGEIAVFLHSANPENWPLAETQAMMQSHLDLTLQEAAANLHGDFAGDIAAYDEVHAEILEMADMLSLGIIHQFPKDFK